MPPALPDHSQNRPQCPVGPRILLARPDHLGDVLLTLPAALALRRLLPSARIGYVVAPSMAPIVERCPAVDETIAVPFPPPTAPAHPSGWADVVATAATVLADRFDIAILPRVDDPWSGAVVAAAGVPVRIGYAAPATRPFLTLPTELPGHRHVADLALDLARVAARLLGGPSWDGHPQACTRSGEPVVPYIVPTPADKAEAAAVLRLQDGADRSGPILLHPGSGWPVKNWPASRWGSLASELRRRYRTVPLVVGGPGEEALVDAVVQASAGAARGVAGRLSLGGLAALQQRARLVIATDSGPLHLASMVGTPVVGLYGPADPQEFGPIGHPDRLRIVRASLPCSPCRILDTPPCGARSAAPCLTLVTVDRVLAAVADLLPAPAHDQPRLSPLAVAATSS